MAAGAAADAGLRRGQSADAALCNGLDLHVLARVFAVFLMALAVYFLVVARRMCIRAPKPAAGVVCGALCGVSAGLFAIGGPPMAVYFVAAAEDHATYLACMQLLFTITGMTRRFCRAGWEMVPA